MANSIARAKRPKAKNLHLLARFSFFALMCLATPSLATSKHIDFTGQLDYTTFQQAAQADESVTIRQSPGGSGAAALALARVSKVVIDGQCNSACAWSFVRNENACFTSRASFGFHAAHDPGTGQRLNAATSYWLSSVRLELRNRLGGLLTSSSLIRLNASQMRAYYGDRACGAKPNIQIASKIAVVKRKKDRAENRKLSRSNISAIASAPASTPTTDVGAAPAIALQASTAEPDRLNLNVPHEFVALESPSVTLLALREVPRSISTKTVAELGSIIANDSQAHPLAQIPEIDPKAVVPNQITDEPKKVAYGSTLQVMIDPKDADGGISSMTGYLHALSDHAKKVVTDSGDVAASLFRVKVAALDRSDTRNSNIPSFPGQSIFVELCAITPRRRSRTDLSHTS